CTAMSATMSRSCAQPSDSHHKHRNACTLCPPTLTPSNAFVPVSDSSRAPFLGVEKGAGVAEVAYGQVHPAHALFVGEWLAFVVQIECSLIEVSCKRLQPLLQCRDMGAGFIPFGLESVE